MVNKKEEIVKIAIDYIKQYNFVNLNYDYLAKKLGITTTAIHYYFKNKKDLGIEICNHLEQGLNKQLIQFQQDLEKEPWEFIEKRTSFLKDDEVCPIASLQSNINCYDSDMKQKVIELVELEYLVYVKILARKADLSVAEKYAKVHLSAIKGAQFFHRSVSFSDFKAILLFIKSDLHNFNKESEVRI